MEKFEQLVRKTMKEYGIDDRLTNIILSNKSPEEITKAIEKTVLEIAEEKKKAEEKENKYRKRNISRNRKRSGRRNLYAWWRAFNNCHFVSWLSC